MKPREIHIEIGELVLDGFARRDRHAIAEAVERELVRLFADSAFAPARSYAVGSIAPAAVKLNPNSKPQASGEAIAGAVHKGINPR